MSNVYVGFWTDHSRIETRVDENQLVRVETTNFLRVVHNLYWQGMTASPGNLGSKSPTPS